MALHRVMMRPVHAENRAILPFSAENCTDALSRGWPATVHHPRIGPSLADMVSRSLHRRAMYMLIVC